jgi:hypothetical protein
MNDAAVSLDGAFAETSDHVASADESAAPAAKRAEPSVREYPSYRSSNLDRLLCANAYCSGLFGSIVTLLRLRGAPYRAKDPGIGFDQPAIAFHVYQSVLISLPYLVLEVMLLLGPGRTEMRSGAFGIVATLVSVLVVAKICCVNYWLPRISFRDSRSTAGIFIPIIGPLAGWFRDRLFPPNSRAQANTIYFSGDRPFVGYGTEVNSWSLVIDTSAAGSGLHDLVGATPEPRPLTTAELYKAVLSGVASVNVNSMRCDRRLFVDGVAVDGEKRAIGRRYRRPPERLSTDRICLLDEEATSGRNYMMLQMQQPAQDLLVTLFIRFQKEGKLIFCEFSSYVLPPGPSGLYRIGHLFRINGLLYSLYAIVVALLIGVGCGVIYLAIAETVLMLGPPKFLDPFLLPAQIIPAHPSIMDSLAKRDRVGAVLPALNFSLMGYAVVITSLLYLCLQALSRGLRWLIATIGILFNVSRQFGIPFSFRERFASRSSLKYYSLQEVVRFLKVQEKILIKSIFELLKERGIDTSDFKESLTAYINQGVINSGDIRGNVFTRIKSFVGRRPSRSAVRRPARRMAANG